MRILLKVDGSVLEDVLSRTTHELLGILVAQSLHVVGDGSSLELLVERDLLELHLVHAGSGGAQQGRERSGGLHDG
jgi:hypothetical protein